MVYSWEKKKTSQNIHQSEMFQPCLSTGGYQLRNKLKPIPGAIPKKCPASM